MTLAETLDQAGNVNIPLAWMLGVVGSLATVVTVLAKMLWGTVNRQIDTLTRQIDRMQRRIETLQKGCGLGGCKWGQ